MSKRISRMIVFSIFIILILEFIYIAKTAILKDFKGVNLATYSAKRKENEEIIPAKRGEIKDRNGQIIATNTTKYDIIAVLDKSIEHVTNIKDTSQKLAKVCKSSSKEIESYLKKDLFQVELGSGCRNLTIRQKEEIDKMKIKGLIFNEKVSRFYPISNFASQILGFATNDFKTGVLTGKTGIEKLLNEKLKGEDGKKIYNVDSKGNLLPTKNKNFISSKPGKDIYLTLDWRIQNIIEEVSEKAYKIYNPETLMMIAVDPKTGDILGSSAYPSFDLNKKNNIKTYENQLSSKLYEPGSTMKTFLWAADMSLNKYNGSELYQSGSYSFSSGEVVRDWNKVGWGSISLDKGFQRSSNTAAIKIGKNSIGYENYYNKFLKKMRFDKPSNVYGMSESEKPTIQFNYETEKANVMFGQGMTTTATNIMSAFTAIGSKTGDQLGLNIIDKIVDQKGKIDYKSERKVVSENVYSKESTKKILKLMETVVTDPKGTAYGKVGNIPGYDVAAKTGTAQIASQGGYTNSDTQFLYSAFVAAPAKNPEVLIYAMLEKPKNLAPAQNSGTRALGNSINPVLSNALSILNVKPDHPEELEHKKNIKNSKEIVIPSYINNKVNDAIKKVRSINANYVIVGSGDTIIDQLPKANNNYFGSEVIVLFTNGDMTMPDLKNLSRRQVLFIAEKLKIKVNFSNQGYVKYQSIPANTKVKENTILNVVLG